MANFTLKKHVEFSFNIEGVDGLFTIPALGALTMEDMELIQKIADEKESLTKKNEFVKAFLLKYAPALADTGIGDVDYNIIFAEYEKAQGQNASAGK